MEDANCVGMRIGNGRAINATVVIVIYGGRMRNKSETFLAVTYFNVPLIDSQRVTNLLLQC